ncbi:MAG: hypothetical protein HYZ37_17015, partial [Candidatus Solibacter usitatus]|nr:hypothetical protein [Candidatus Solibacter usitatus]
MQIKSVAVLAGLVLAASSYAVETHFWQHFDPSDYEKATLKNLALRSDGRLSLAPVFKEIHDPSLAYLWAVAADSKGNVYFGGGTPGASSAKLFQKDPAGKVKTLAEVAGLEIHAIAVNSRDQVFAATSPDGKVYRLGADGKPVVHYDPKAKYIWAMAFDSKGNLYVGTGDKGEVHRVTPDGRGAMFFATDETHARSLAVDSKDNLIVGTDPGGLILRVAANGTGFVLYQSGKREITAVAAAKSGYIYAAGVGTKTAAAVSLNIQVPAPVPQAQPAVNPQAAAAARTPPPATLGPALTSIPGGSEVYAIDAEGAPRKIWSHSSDLVYAIGFDAQQRPLLGTGNRGQILRLDSDRLYTTLVRSTSSQITGLVGGSSGAVYAVTGNMGKLFQLGPGLEREGILESDALDAGAFTYWGRARYEGTAGGGAIALDTRSGNLDRPQKNWSAWEPVKMNSTFGKTVSPAARFLQYRVKITAATDGASPALSLIEFAYLNKNVAPAVEMVESTPASYRFPAASASLAYSSNTLTLQPL